MKNKEEWYKENPTDKVWWLDNGKIGEIIFSFDKKTRFNVYSDYPHKLTKEQREIFDKENPDWMIMFSER